MASASIQKLGVLQPQEVILGLFGEYVRPGDQAWSGGLVGLLRELGFSEAASRIALNRVVARGLLDPTRSGRFVSYVMTARMEMVHTEGRRQMFARAVEPEWNGDWTLVWYSIPEERRTERSRLGRWLNFRGFGTLQDGTWIAPGDSRDDVTALIRKLGLESSVLIFAGALSTSLSTEDVVSRAWKIDELRTMYDMYIDEFRPLAAAETLSGMNARDAFVARTRVIESFRQLAVLDPNLPERVLKGEWRRREAIELFRNLQAALQDRAQKFFADGVLTRSPADGA